MNAAEPIDGSTATPAELQRAGIDALVRALGPVGMARFLRRFAPGAGAGRRLGRTPPKLPLANAAMHLSLLQLVAPSVLPKSYQALEAS
jgi:hypothetical protein